MLTDNMLPNGRHRLVTLGRLALVGPDDTEEPSLGKQRRKLALLAVLALARRPLARDYLIELFWGEQEEARARHSLSEALSHLRRVLGRDAITTRQADVALAEATCPTVDAHELARAAAAHDHARVVALYGGPFLDCVYLGSTSFDNWVQGERSRLEALFLQACEAQCTALARARQWEECAAVSARWLAVAPLSPQAAVFRLNALKMPGTVEADRRALAEYERLAALLAREYDLAPDRAVSELAATIADRLAAAAPRAAAPAAAAGGEITAPSTKAPPALPAPALTAPALAAKGDAAGSEPAPTATDRAVGERVRTAPQPGVRGWTAGRRRVVLAAAVAVLAVLAAAVVVAFRRPAAAPTSGAVVAVLPFAVRGGEQYTYLQEGMVDLLSTNLDGAGTLRAVDPRALLGRVARARDGEAARTDRVLAPEEARDIARGFGAGLFVLGDVVGVGERVRISASLYDTRQGGREVARAVADGTPTELFALVDQLTRQLLAGYPGQSPDHLTGLAALTTSSLPALKAYLAGASEYRAGRFNTAEAAFQQALALDSTFALAHYQLSNTLLWLARGTWDSVTTMGLRAQRHSARLTQRARLVIEAYAAFRTGDLDRAEALYHSIVTAYPDEVEAWYQLGDVLYHGNAPRGRSFVEARPAFTRVLEIEPNHVGALLHLLRIAIWQRRYAEADTLVRRASALGTPALRAELAALRAVAMGDAAAQNKAIRELREMHDEAVRGTAMRVALFIGDLDAAGRITRMLIAPERSREVQAAGRVHLAELFAARGRRRAARAQLDSAGLTSPGVGAVVAREYRALQLAQPFLSAPRAEREAMRDTLRRWDAVVPPTNFALWSIYNGMHGHIRRYLIGLLSVRLGDLEEAERQARTLEVEAAARTGDARGLAAGFGRSLRGHVLAERGALDSALAAFESGRVLVSEGLLDTPFGNQSTDRYARAEVLRALGRDAEAHAWYASLGETAMDVVVFAAPAHLRRAEMYERRGKPRQVAEHYARFIELWRNADPELRPAVLQAQTRLARLSSGGE
jgi:DNA-binding SARP family transcriptional activator/tetratricopeptide (TPR) repeat protein